MHEFETFVYLDMEKTGSTFISNLLRKFCWEKEIRRVHHRHLTTEYDPSKFYFISVRNPLDCYLSLYSYGCSGEGKVRAWFKGKDKDGLYDGTEKSFNKWLNYVLKPQNSYALGDRYGTMAQGGIAEMMGLQSYRYLRLAIATPTRVLSKCYTVDDVRAAYAKNKLPGFVIRHESFVDDISALLRGPLRKSIYDLDAALEYVATAKPSNTSDRIDSDAKIVLNKKTEIRLREREWLLQELFGY